MSDDAAQAARRLLTQLKQRLVAGEIDEATYQRQREWILADLTAEERAALGVSSTPQPVAAGAASPRSGTPAPLGPSGGLRGGLRTARASLSDLELEPGSMLLGQWRLVRELGRGGFGAVFEAEELHLHERQAVKVLDPAMVAKEELLARFRREVSLMRKLVHPRIVRVYDYREDLEQSLALISMELVAHGSVKQLLAEAKRAGRPVPIPLAVTLLGQILEALAEAHRQGVIHRDVTPGNVLLAGGSPEQLLQDRELDPQVKLVDFGIAGLVERTELSAKSRVLGTAAYVAPEVLDASAEVTPAADVYGAGAIAYELLTGELPSGRFENPRELRAEIPDAIEQFVMRLLERRPERRPTAPRAVTDLAAVAERRREEEERRLRDDAERARQQAAAAAAERQRQEAALKERQEAERRAVEAERQLQAEQAPLAEEARHLREAPPAPARAHPSMEASVPKPARRGSSPLAWLGIVALIVAVVAGIGWGVKQQREADRQRVLAEQQRQVAVAEEQRKAQEAIEAERRRQAQLLEQEKQKAATAAAQAERERIAREQEDAKRAAVARQEQEARTTEATAARQREADAAAHRLREAEAAALRQREAEAAAARERAQPAGPWRDERTGLLWTAKDNGSDITWDGAKSYCENLSLEGFSDWRLPSIAELESFYDGRRSLTQRGAVRLTSWWVWSGDLQSGDSSRAWYFYFFNGQRGWDPRNDAPNNRALCVRRSGG